MLFKHTAHGSKKTWKKGEEKHYSRPCGRIITKKGDCLFQLQTSSFTQLFLHSPISSGWEIGWKINETQDTKTSEPQQQETDIVIAQNRAGPELFSFIQSAYNDSIPVQHVMLHGFILSELINVVLSQSDIIDLNT